MLAFIHNYAESRSQSRAILNMSPATFSDWGTRGIQLPPRWGRVINIFDDAPAAVPMRARSGSPSCTYVREETRRNLINHATWLPRGLAPETEMIKMHPAWFQWHIHYGFPTIVISSCYRAQREANLDAHVMYFPNYASKNKRARWTSIHNPMMLNCTNSDSLNWNKLNSTHLFAVPC